MATWSQSIVAGSSGGAAASVPKTGLPSGAFKATLVAGGVAGNHTVAGIAVGDEIWAVLHASTAASVATVADLTSEFSIDSADTIDNAAGTDTTSDQLWVFWVDKTENG